MRQMFVFNLNRDSAVEISERQHEGRTYLVAPVVAIIEGVLNGRLVPGDEIGRHVESWNGIPLPLNHPQANGLPVSAQSPEIIENLCVGYFWNAHYDNGVLRGEMWIDVEKCRKLGGDGLVLLENLNEGKIIEVSTAYFCDSEPSAGTYKNKPYQGISRNLRPDHLAILLHEEGACNVEQGCGVPRTNANEANHDGMIAFYPSLEGQTALAKYVQDWPDGADFIPQMDTHLTLAYLGLIVNVPVNETEMTEVLFNFAQNMPPLRGKVNGTAVFHQTHDDNKAAVVALFDSPSLPAWREQLCYYLNENNISYDTKHGFIPHLTLGYIPADEPFVCHPVSEPLDLEFSQVALAWGDSVSVFNLVDGRNPAALSNQPPNPIKEIPFPSPKPTKNALSPDLLLPTQHKEFTVNRDELIQAIATATATDPTAYENLSDDVLNALYAQIEAQADSAEADPAAPAPAERTGFELELSELASLLAEYGGVEGLRGALSANQGLSEKIETLGDLDVLRQVVESAHQAQKDERTNLVDILTNAKNSLEADELSDLSTGILKKMVEAIAPAEGVYLRPWPQTNKAGEEEPSFEPYYTPTYSLLKNANGQ